MEIKRRLSKRSFTDELSEAFPGVEDTSWVLCNNILTNLYQRIAQEINPEHFRFVLLSSAARQIVKPSVKYREVRESVRSFFNKAYSQREVPANNPALFRAYTTLDEMGKPDIDIAAILLSAEAVDPNQFMKYITDLSCNAGGLHPATFQVPTNRHITVTNISLSENPLDPTLQFFPFISFGDSSTEFVDKRLGWCTTPGTRGHISLLPHGDPPNMYLYQQDWQNFRERLDRPDTFLWQGHFDDLDLLEALLRGFQVKAMYSPEIEPFEHTSQTKIADFVSNSLLGFKQDSFNSNPIRSDKLTLFMKQLLCTRLSGQDYFRNQILQHPEYGMQMTDLVNTISAIQHNDNDRFNFSADTVADMSDEEFARYLLGDSVN